MNKCLMVVFMILGLTSCNEGNKSYYLSHPKELQQALKACPNQAPQGLSCDEIEQLAIYMTKLAYQLQSNPQAFGNQILILQQNIANQYLESKNQNTNKELKMSLAKNQQDLADFLNVVKWLESPES